MLRQCLTIPKQLIIIIYTSVSDQASFLPPSAALEVDFRLIGGTVDAGNDFAPTAAKTR